MGKGIVNSCHSSSLSVVTLALAVAFTSATSHLQLLPLGGDVTSDFLSVL